MAATTGLTIPAVTSLSARKSLGSVAEEARAASGGPAKHQGLQVRIVLVTLQFLKKFRKRGIFAVLFAVTAILVGSALPAKANIGVDEFTVLGADVSSLVHDCRVMGVPHDGYEGVVCVDIQMGGGANNYSAKGEVEAYCQTTAGVAVRCPYIMVTGVFADGAGGEYSTDGYWYCGTGTLTCSSGRNVITEGAIGYNYPNAATDCWQYPNSDWDIWTVATSAGMLIELPVSDDYVSLSSNFETGHYYACPSIYDGVG